MSNLSVDHILGIKYLETSDIELIFKTADNFKKIINQPIKKVPSLRDITIANLFFEHSTRTKLDQPSQYIFHKEWSDDYSNLITFLSTVLSKKDGLSDSQAQKIVSEIASNYFLTGIRNSRLKNTQLKSTKSLVRILLARNLPYNLKILIYICQNYSKTR